MNHFKLLTFIVISIKQTIAKFWKSPSWIFHDVKNQITETMIYENMTAKLFYKLTSFDNLWAPWFKHFLPPMIYHLPWLYTRGKVELISCLKMIILHWISPIQESQNNIFKNHFQNIFAVLKFIFLFLWTSTWVRCICKISHVMWPIKWCFPAGICDIQNVLCEFRGNASQMCIGMLICS